MASVTWTFQALSDLDDIRAWIAPDRPRAAQRMETRLRAAAASLDRRPNRGRPISDGRRELVHVRPYLIRYRVEGARVIILEVRHAARKPD